MDANNHDKRRKMCCAPGQCAGCQLFQGESQVEQTPNTKQSLRVQMTLEQAYPIEY
ncbi:hypothetical protein LEMA_P032580.1 [Plenodomus lingam JN3]|uniref:Uncharacterized protein n=1 Tax=Leptosphaeria maculans (strain JN3 / isolate v23.1.3 / race Av1-4-5-6-7-8) TaxID=985895 RepID=E4ZWY0_LEPMJ|nr:hypothetical protein LEMA_P032580.1 [Plenodomus lingam JN3]CBX96106.1 hypothetical protein LEMA_P032580.1 [Plenodomus lingam JN3]